MDFIQDKTYTDSSNRITIQNYLPQIGKEEAVENILAGLRAEQKYVSSLFFYDPEGSRLFEEVTHLPEYYPSRTEKGILREHASLFVPHLRDTDIIEIGSGDASKISILLEQIPELHRESVRYVPVDVSQSAIEESAAILVDNFSGLEVHGIVADFLRQISLLPAGDRKIICFFGSTIGNLERSEGLAFFQELGRVMQTEDLLLLGLDLVKEVAIIEKAYNDSQGITARFNRNILNVVNKIAGCNFVPEEFEHLAFYNPEQERIEMHLRARHDLEVTCPHLDEAICFHQGETIHTENSHKFRRDHMAALAEAAGLSIDDMYTDDREYFALVRMRKG